MRGFFSIFSFFSDQSIRKGKFLQCSYCTQKCNQGYFKLARKCYLIITVNRVSFFLSLKKKKEVNKTDPKSHKPLCAASCRQHVYSGSGWGWRGNGRDTQNNIRRHGQKLQTRLIFFPSFLLNKVAEEWGGGSTSRGISIKPFIDLGSLASSKKPGPFPVLRQHSSSVAHKIMAQLSPLF